MLGKVQVFKVYMLFSYAMVSSIVRTSTNIDT